METRMKLRNPIKPLAGYDPRYHGYMCCHCGRIGFTRVGVAQHEETCKARPQETK